MADEVKVDNGEPEVSNPAPEGLQSPVDPLTAMKLMLEQMLVPMKTHMEELEAENRRLRETAEKKQGVGFADNIPFHLRSDDPLVPVEDNRFGRRVVLGTAAADPDFVRREIPHAQGRIVNHGGLVKNTIQNVIGSSGETEDAPH